MAKFFDYNSKKYRSFFEADSSEEALEMVNTVFLHRGRAHYMGEPHTLRECEIAEKDMGGFAQIGMLIRKSDPLFKDILAKQHQ